MAQDVIGSAPRLRLTEAGLRRLQAELEELVDEAVPEVADRIRAIRENTSDVIESGDYLQAMDELALLQARIASLHALIGSGEVVRPRRRTGVVDLGSRVTLAEDGFRETFTVVGAAEADALAGLISDQSPLGRSLLGHRAGDDVEWPSPAGTNRARILTVKSA